MLLDSGSGDDDADTKSDRRSKAFARLSGGCAAWWLGGCAAWWLGGCAAWVWVMMLLSVAAEANTEQPIRINGIVQVLPRPVQQAFGGATDPIR